MIIKSANSYRLPFWQCILLVFCLLADASCQSYGPRNERLRAAEDLIWTEPMQTLALLDSIDTHSLSQEDNNYFQFIHEHACYRAQLPLSPDSLPMLSAYFLEHGNKLYAGRVMYVLGAELDWLHKPYEALIPLKDAERYLSECGCMDLYMGMTYYRLGSVYEKESLYDIAHVLYQKALPVFQNQRHTFYLATTNRDLARTIRDDTEENRQKEKKYFQQALYYAEQTGNMALYYEIICIAQDLLYETSGIHDYEAARQVMSIYPNNACLLFEHYFPDNLDSAKYFLDIYGTDSIRAAYNRNQYYYLLSHYLYARGQKDSAFHLMDQRYLAYQQDAIDHGHQRMYAIARQYDVAREREEVLNQKLQKRRNTLCLTFGLLILASVLVIALLRLIKRKNQQLAQEQQLQNLNRDLLQKQQDLQQKQHDLQMKQDVLRQKLEIQIKLIRQLNIWQMGTTEDSVYEKRIKQLSHDFSFKGKQLKDFQFEFGVCYPELQKRLVTSYPELTSFELLLISLMVLKLSIQDICILLDISNRTLYNHRNLIKQHLGLQDSDNLDTWIKKLV